MADNLTIRPIAPADRAGWDRLYAGYAAFYLVTQTDAMRDRMFDFQGINALLGTEAMLERGKGYEDAGS